MGRKTPLFETHRAEGAKIVDFGGWDMPLHYGSQLEEHHRVRNGAGVFDVSHMCIIDLAGASCRDFLQYLLANDVAKLRKPGKALYSCMLNQSGGVIDDLIVYFLQEFAFRLVVNAGTRDKDLDWIRKHAARFSVVVTERTDLAILAVQGPDARAKVIELLDEPQRRAVADVAVFTGVTAAGWFIARTGYTGEDGFELLIPTAQASTTWQALRIGGVWPVGLGARDTLRLEAGMNLYGNDMDETQNPLESGLGWSVAFDPRDRDFIGRAALESIHLSRTKKFVGLLLEDRGVLRAHQVVQTSAGVGETTSGGFSPTLNRSIAFARIPQAAGETVQVDIRGKLLPARVIKLPFVRNGKAQFSI